MVDETFNHDEPGNSHSVDPPVEPLPPEVATLLILIGIAAIPLPGPGIPFILAGGLSLWPKTFGPMNVKFRRAYPNSHRKVRQVLSRFEQDLHRRYPAE
jgi:hypothetical protein